VDVRASAALHAERTVEVVRVQTSEKLYRDIEIRALGSSGHSSIPRGNLAILKLAAVLPRLSAVYGGVATTGEVPAGTTCVVTLIHAGEKANIIPGSAVATMNCRVVPTERWSDVVARLREAAAGSDVTLVPDEEAPAFTPPADSPPAGPVWEAIRESAAALWPAAPVVPFTSGGATDCRNFRRAHIACYGLLPFPLTAAEDGAMHGDNERLPVISFEAGIRFLARVVVHVITR